MVDMEKDMTEVVLKVTRMTEVLKDYEVLRSQLNNVLDLLLPGDGHDLLPLGGQDWPALKDQVIGWMAAGSHTGQEYDCVQRQTFGSGTRRVDVEVEHLLDNYWWVTATPDRGQQAPPALRGGLLGPHLLTGRRGGRREPLTGPGGSPGPEPGRMPGTA